MGLNSGKSNKTLIWQPINHKIDLILSLHHSGWWCPNNDAETVLKMIRTLKRRFIMPCRGGFIFLFVVALIISLILIIHTSRNEPNLLIKNIKEKHMQEANHISALKDGCSDPRCMMKGDCKGKKVYFFSNSLKVLIYWDHKTNQKN